MGFLRKSKKPGKKVIFNLSKNHSFLKNLSYFLQKDKKDKAITNKHKKSKTILKFEKTKTNLRISFSKKYRKFIKFGNL